MIEIKNRYTGEIIVKLNVANLSGANLSEANLNFVYLQIQGSRHNLILTDNQIQIGCEFHLISEWLEYYQNIGQEHDYTPEQIQEYFGYIKICDQLYKNYKGERK